MKGIRTFLVNIRTAKVNGPCRFGNAVRTFPVIARTFLVRISTAVKVTGKTRPLNLID